MRIQSCVAAAVIVGSGLTLGAQDTPLPAFEVISIKSRTGAVPIGPVRQSPDRFENPDVTALQLIGFAYQLEESQVLNGPSWMKSSRFDVSAKANQPVSQAQMRLMVRLLLADRFGLKAHTEKRELGTYALALVRGDGKLGERMRPSTIDCQAIIEARKVPPPIGDAAPQCLWRIAVTSSSATMMVDGVSMGRFAALLEPMARRPVRDTTGLAGTYDINFEFAPDLAGLLGAPPNPGGTTAPPRDGLSLFTALQEQLGLKLESNRGPVDVLVIDGAVRPVPD